MSPVPPLTTSGSPAGTATWNRAPQWKTSPVQSMDSRKVSPLRVHVA